MSQGTGTGEVLLIKLSEWHAMDTFAERLDALIESGIVRIAMDMEDVAIVNSTLLGLFVKTRHTVKPLGGDFVIVNPSPFVSKTMGVLGLDEIFTVVPDAGTAIRHFQ
jgi:anti-anti-sigma factor